MKRELKAEQKNAGDKVVKSPTPARKLVDAKTSPSKKQTVFEENKSDLLVNPSKTPDMTPDPKKIKKDKKTPDDAMEPIKPKKP